MRGQGLGEAIGLLAYLELTAENRRRCLRDRYHVPVTCVPVTTAAPSTYLVPFVSQETTWLPGASPCAAAAEYPTAAFQLSLTVPAASGPGGQVSLANSFRTAENEVLGGDRYREVRQAEHGGAPPDDRTRG